MAILIKSTTLSKWDDLGSIIRPTGGKDVNVPNGLTLKGSITAAGVTGTALSDLVSGVATQFVRNPTDVSDAGAASKIIKMRSDGKIPASDGSLLTNLTVGNMKLVGQSRVATNFVGASTGTNILDSGPAIAIPTTVINGVLVIATADIHVEPGNSVDGWASVEARVDGGATTGSSFAYQIYTGATVFTDSPTSQYHLSTDYAGRGLFTRLAAVSGAPSIVVQCADAFVITTSNGYTPNSLNRVRFHKFFADGGTPSSAVVKYLTLIVIGF